MSDPVQLEEKKSGKSKKSKESKKSSVKSKNVEEPEKKSQNDNTEEKNNEVEKNENKANTPPQLSTRAYLEQNVVPVVQDALLECAKQRPSNPLEFVGNFILDRAKGK
jgi:hypothetical protein